MKRDVGETFHAELRKDTSDSSSSQADLNSVSHAEGHLQGVVIKTENAGSDSELNENSCSNQFVQGLIADEQSGAEMTQALDVKEACDTEANISDSDPNKSLNLEAVEGVDDIQITGVEVGSVQIPQENWGPSISMGNFDPLSATGSQADMTAHSGQDQNSKCRFNKNQNCKRKQKKNG